MTNEGLKLRNNYEAFFRQNLDNSDFKVVSAQLNRTMESAFYFMNAVNGSSSQIPANEKMEEKREYLRKINFQGYPQNKNIIFAAYTSISPNAENMSSLRSKKMLKERVGFEDFGPYLGEISKKCGKLEEEMNYWVLFYLHDSLLTYKTHDLELPPGFSEDMYRSLRNVPLHIFYGIWMNNEKTRKIANYVIFKQLVQITESEKSKPRFIYYSSHDACIVGILVSFGYKTRTIPNFGAKLVIEVHRDTDLVILTYLNEGREELVFRGGKKEFVDILKNQMFPSDQEFLEAVGNQRLIQKGSSLKFNLDMEGI